MPDSSLKSVVREGFQIETDDETSARMGGVRQRGTKPEVTVRAAVSSLGKRYRLENRDLPGSPDLANRSQKWAIMVHGCYWHRHPGCSRATTPKRNRGFWEAKFARNVARDRKVLRELRQLGFSVLVLWECEVSRQPEKTMSRLRRFFAK